MFINERKRKLESIQRIAEWQATVDDWQVIVSPLSPAATCSLMLLYIGIM